MEEANVLLPGSNAEKVEKVSETGNKSSPLYLNKSPVEQNTALPSVGMQSDLINGSVVDSPEKLTVNSISIPAEEMSELVIEAVVVEDVEAVGVPVCSTRVGAEEILLSAASLSVAENSHEGTVSEVSRGIKDAVVDEATKLPDPVTHHSRPSAVAEELQDPKGEENSQPASTIKRVEKSRVRIKPPAPTRRPPPPVPTRKVALQKSAAASVTNDSKVKSPSKRVKFQSDVNVGQSTTNHSRESGVASGKPEKSQVPAKESVRENRSAPSRITSEQSSKSSFTSDSPKPSISRSKSCGDFDTTAVMNPAFRKSFLKVKKRRSGGFLRSMLKKNPAALKWSSCEVAAWLELLGLESYAEKFLANGVDGSTLLELDTRQFAQGLGVTNELHIVSLELGVMQLLLERIDYDKWDWSAEKVSKWLSLRGFGCLTETFKDAAIHGGVLFNVEMSYLMNTVGVKKINSSPIFAESLSASIERAKSVGSRIMEMRHSEPPLGLDRPGVFFVHDQIDGSADNREILDWGPTDVEEWLKKQHVGHLAETFNRHGINGTILVELTRERLEKQMGLTEIQAIVLAKGLYRLKRMQRKGLGSLFRSRSSKKLSNLQKSGELQLARARSEIPVAQRIDFDVEMEVEMELASKGAYPKTMANRAKKFGEVLSSLHSEKKQ
mmetsp:Transcript_9288/g.10591  ORF Transcript_9288/g.10591 Transcript_9288/m.10591 type:complete len:666 (+) Transcript_9288:110-2107(+)